MRDFYEGKKVVVLGGAGFVGGELSSLLVELGANVVVVDNLSRGKRIVKGVDFYRGDVSKFDTCSFFMKGAFAVFNLAATVAGVLYNTSHQIEMYKTNIDLLTVPVMGAEAASVPNFMQTSSVCVYAPENQILAQEPFGLVGKPHAANAGYSEAKRDGERVALWSNIERPIIVRPTNVVGAYDYFDDKAHVIPAIIRKVFEEPEIHAYGKPGVIREFINNKDVARGMAFAVARGRAREAYNVGTNGNTTIEMGMLIDTVKKLALDYYGVPDKPIVWHMRSGGDPARRTSTAKLGGLGWRYNIPLIDSIKEAMDYYVKEVQNPSNN